MIKDTGELNQRRRELIEMTGEYTSKIVAFKIQADTAKSSRMQRARFGMMAFAKSLDGNYIDIMLAIYTLEFKLARYVVYKENSLLWGLYKWSSYPDVEVDKSISKDDIEKIQNFFRYKALKEFKNEGIIDRISFTGKDESG